MDGVTTAHRGRSLYILADTDRAASAISRSECQSCKRKKYDARQEGGNSVHSTLCVAFRLKPFIGTRQS